MKIGFSSSVVLIMLFQLVPFSGYLYTSETHVAILNEHKECSIDFLPLCYFLEKPFGAERTMLEQGFTGAIMEELIKAIEQDMVIIATTILVAYLKELLLNKADQQNISDCLQNYFLFQTELNNFILLLPIKYIKNYVNLGFGPKLKPIIFSDLKISSDGEINLNELQSIFDNRSTIPKSIYLSGHGQPAAPQTDPLIASLTFNQYEEFIKHLNCLNCKFLYVSSCYAAGLNMVKAHKNLYHAFPVIIGNLADSDSHFHPKIDFREYFALLNFTINKNLKSRDLIRSDRFNKALKVISGDSISNIPSLKLPNCRHFFLLNPNRYLIVNNRTSSYSKAVSNIKYILITSPNIEKTLTIRAKNVFEIISAIPGNSYHIFRRIEIENQTFLDFINVFLKTFYQYKKTFFIKKLFISYFPQTAPLKRTKIKNVLIVNHGAKHDILSKVESHHELYFQKGSSFYRVYIPSGLKLGYYPAKISSMPLYIKKNLIKNFLRLSKPHHHALPLACA